MSSDPWHQWQALLSAFGSQPGVFPFGGAAGPGFSGAGSAGPAPGGLRGVPPAFAPFADAGARFAAALEEYLQGVAALGQAPPGGASESVRAASERFNDFLRDQFAGMFRPPGSSEMPGTAPSASAYPSGPALGPAREQILRAQRAYEAWNRLAQAQTKLQRLWSDTLNRAATEFTARLHAKPSTAPSAEALNALYDQWIDCAERAYASTAHGDAFSDALSEHVNAAADWRRESAAGIEDWAKFWDLPTRSEINSLTQRLKELEARLAPQPKANSAGPAAGTQRPAKPPPRRKAAGAKRSSR